MIYALPEVGKDAVALPHFPTRHQAFIFRAYEYVPIEKIAKVLKTSVQDIRQAAAQMGLPDYDPGDTWLRRGNITVIRRLWHILPYDQLLELLETDEQTLALIMRAEDFLDIKLADKPRCARVTWRPLTEEEARRTQEIQKIMKTLCFSGKRPFDFEYNVPPMKFEGNALFATRMIYAFSGLYQGAFDVDSEEFLSDAQLQAYRSLGINGIWTQGILSQLAPFPFDPSVSAGYEQRVARMRAMTERLARYGIKLYLYLNEPRSMPLAFFEKYPELRGHVRGGDACLCTSAPRVQDYLADAVESICRAVPQIGGFFTITRSENMTNCYSHSTPKNCTCPRCKARPLSTVIAETVNCFLTGARRVSREIKVFAWSWRWDSFNEDIIRQLPKEAILLSQSELEIPFEIGGVSGSVIDYSMSIPGPGERAKREWQVARECGLETGAKVQINTTWEASTVPAVPVSPSVEAHMQRLQNEKVGHLLLSWTLGGYPSRNIAAAARYFYEKCTMPSVNEPLRAAEEQFVRAFVEFPFHVSVLYGGPQNAGPSNLLFMEPTGYSGTMTCFAYDDLKRWCGPYPEAVFEAQFEKLCRAWEAGLALLPKDDTSEGTVMAWATYDLFRSSLNQIRFIRARDAGRLADAAAAAKDEIAVARDMLKWMNVNAAIGYEAANHYYFSKGQLAEKVLNCQYIADAWSE